MSKVLIWRGGRLARRRFIGPSRNSSTTAARYSRYGSLLSLGPSSSRMALRTKAKKSERSKNLSSRFIIWILCGRGRVVVFIKRRGSTPHFTAHEFLKNFEIVWRCWFRLVVL